MSFAYDAPTLYAIRFLPCFSFKDMTPVYWLVLVLLIKDRFNCGVQGKPQGLTAYKPILWWYQEETKLKERLWKGHASIIMSKPSTRDFLYRHIAPTGSTSARSVVCLRSFFKSKMLNRMVETPMLSVKGLVLCPVVASNLYVCPSSHISGPIVHVWLIKCSESTLLDYSYRFSCLLMYLCWGLPTGADGQGDRVILSCCFYINISNMAYNDTLLHACISRLKCTI